VCTFEDSCEGGQCKGVRPEFTIDLTSQDGFVISADPAMPKLRAIASVNGTIRDPEKLRFKWKLEAKWQVPGRSFAVTLDPPLEQSGDWSTDLSFGPRFRGGDLTLSAALLGQDGVTVCKEVKRQFPKKIFGSNPPPADIVSTATAYSGVTFARIACHEAFAKHFGLFVPAGAPSIGLDPNGVSWGVGLMQVTDGRENADIYWHWRINMGVGLTIWNSKMADAAGYVGRKRREFPNDEIPDLTRNQLELEAITRYNSGPYWKWNTNTKQWYASPPIMPDGRTYVQRVIADASRVCGI